MIEPRDILEECQENIEREIQAHCEYRAVQKRTVVSIGKEAKDKEQAIKGFTQEFQAMFRFCRDLLIEIRKVKFKKTVVFLNFY